VIALTLSPGGQVAALLPAGERVSDRGQSLADPWARAFCDWCAAVRGLDVLDVAAALLDIPDGQRAAVGSPIGWGALDAIVAEGLGCEPGAVRFPEVH